MLDQRVSCFEFGAQKRRCLRFVKKTLLFVKVGAWF